LVFPLTASESHFAPIAPNLYVPHLRLRLRHPRAMDRMHSIVRRRHILLVDGIATFTQEDSLTDSRTSETDRRTEEGRRTEQKGRHCRPHTRRVSVGRSLATAGERENERASGCAEKERAWCWAGVLAHVVLRCLLGGPRAAHVERNDRRNRRIEG